MKKTCLRYTIYCYSLFIEDYNSSSGSTYTIVDFLRSNAFKDHVWVLNYFVFTQAG